MLVILFGGSVIVFTSLWRWLPKIGIGHTEGSRLTFAEYHALAALFLWVLLATYHRVYDTVLAIAFIALIIFGLGYDNGWNLRERGKRLLFAFLIIFIVVQLLPGAIMDIVLPEHLLETWLQLVSTLFTLTVLTSLVFTLLLLRRLGLNDPAPPTDPDSALVEGTNKSTSSGVGL